MNQIQLAYGYETPDPEFEHLRQFYLKQPAYTFCLWRVDGEYRLATGRLLGETKIFKDNALLPELLQSMRNPESALPFSNAVATRTVPTAPAN